MENVYVSHVHMFKVMWNLQIPKSVKDLLGDDGSYVNTWGEVDAFIQEEYDLSYYRTPPEVASQILTKLRDWYEDNEARKDHITK